MLAMSQTQSFSMMKLIQLQAPVALQVVMQIVEEDELQEQSKKYLIENPY